MEKERNNKKIIIAIVSVVLILAVAGLLIWFLQDKDSTKKPNSEQTEEDGKDNSNTDKDKQNEEKEEDVAWILDCDSIDVLEEKNNIQVITDAGTYVQGSGAYLNSSTLPLFGSGKLREGVDILAYKGGFIHLSFYISSKANFMKDLYFELSSSGVSDKEELQWTIPLSSVQEGWNEKYLSIPDATKTGKIELSSVNYFRFYSPELKTNVSMDVILDNVYATKSSGDTTESGDSSNKNSNTVVPDSYKETGSKYGLRIMSCNTVNILDEVRNLQVTTKAGKYLEGSGAMILTNGANGSCIFSNPINISEYMVEDGKLHVSLYINDISLLTGLTYFYLSSAGTTEDQTMYWYLQTYQLQTGWNKIELPFYTACMKRLPNTEAINYFQIQTAQPKEGIEIILDDIYVTKE